ncbi:MAG: permease-like cell division protein FtsX [Thiohalomonadaceae bacterium]
MSAPERTSGARPVRTGLGTAMRVYLLRHAQTLLYALGQLSSRPLSTLMTAAVIGIALALPAGLHVLLGNARAVTAGWDGATQISVFLRTEVSEARGRALTDEFRARGDLADAHYVSREAALDEFRRLSGFGEALDALEENPLPAVIVLRPALAQNDAAAIGRLLAQLRARPEVERAQLDMEWVKRLYAIMDMVRRGVWVLGGLLSLAVLLVVGNTIRLAIQNRRDEIVLTKLIGGTDAFIRRPFLYAGLWYGLAGGALAILLVSASLWLLSGPAQELAALYQSTFRLRGLAPADAGAVLLAGAVLGLAGSWLAVGRHLRDIEPT